MPALAVLSYPVVLNPELVPTLTRRKLEPFVLTPLNITVTRFTQLGMPVKSMLVPLVDATAVPLTMLSVNSSDPAVAPLRTT